MESLGVKEHGVHPRELRNQRLRTVILGGLTEEEKDAFERIEEQRLVQGVPSIIELKLSSRGFTSLYRFGVKTVQGVEDLLNRGVTPYHFGKKMSEDARRKLISYRESHQPQ